MFSHRIWRDRTYARTLYHSDCSTRSNDRVLKTIAGWKELFSLTVVGQAVENVVGNAHGRLVRVQEVLSGCSFLVIAEVSGLSTKNCVQLINAGRTNDIVELNAKVGIQRERRADFAETRDGSRVDRVRTSIRRVYGTLSGVLCCSGVSRRRKTMSRFGVRIWSGRCGVRNGRLTRSLSSGVLMTLQNTRANEAMSGN